MKGKTPVIQRKRYEESRMLRFLYDTRVGHKMLKIAVKPYVSNTAGKVMDSRISKVFIKRTVKKNELDLSECEKKKYTSYNDFFTRSLKTGMRAVDYKPTNVISPCDGQLTVYPISEQSVFNIKNTGYNLKDLLKNENLAREYGEGMCLVFRLTPTDYHHYFYIDNGITGESRDIAGEFHTVRSLALAYCNIYKRNTRSYTYCIPKTSGILFRWTSARWPSEKARIIRTSIIDSAGRKKRDCSNTAGRRSCCCSEKMSSTLTAGS